MAGSDTKITIFISELKRKLMNHELVIRDSAYRDLKWVYYDGALIDLLRSIRACQESLFKRMKDFSILASRFRHELEYHADMFYCVDNLVQMSIDDGESIFEI